MKRHLQLSLVFVATTIGLAGDQWQMENQIEISDCFWLVLGCGVIMVGHVAVTSYLFKRYPGLSDFFPY